MKINNKIAGYFLTVCLLCQNAHLTPARTLDGILSTLDMIRHEHARIMTELQKMTGRNVNDDTHCQRSKKFIDRATEVLERLEEKLDLPGAKELPEGSGATYIRWRRTECPRVNGTAKVYEGFAAGDYYTHVGGPSELLCLPKEPAWGNYVDGVQGGSYVYGVEYEVGSQSRVMFGKDIDKHNVPCVVCQSVGRIATLKIPGRTDCYKGWTKEYSGYLMASHHGHSKSSDYTCVDADPDVVPETARDQNGQLLYFVESNCHKNSLPCPPYIHGREIACVICTK